MKYIYRLIKLAILLALLVIAIKNTQIVDFNSVFGQPVKWPLIVFLLIFFVVGTVFGIFAMLGRIMTLRNETIRLRRELSKNAKISQQELELATKGTETTEEDDKAANMPPLHP